MDTEATPGALRSNDGLGPLPERRIRHVYNAAKGYECDCWTEDAVREYAAAAVAAERERCAKLCEELEARVWRTYKNGGAANQHTEGRSDGAGECAALIRGA